MIQEFKNTLFEKALASGFSDCEIYSVSEKTFTVTILKGEVAKYENSDSSGVSFRGTYHGVVGYSFSERIDLDVIDILIDAAKQNAEMIESEDKEFLYKGEASYPTISSYSEKLNQVSIEEKIEMAKKMEKAAYDADQRVKTISYCILGSSESTVYLANSLGLSLSDKSTYAVAYMYPNVEENGQTKVAGKTWQGKDFSAFNPVEFAQSAVAEAVSYLGAESIETKTYPILLTNKTTGELLSTFLNIFFAETVHDGFSLLKGKVGEKIASEKVTILDNGLLEGALCSSGFDSEGVSTKNKTVIENGVLKTYLYNLKSANKDNVASTGNGFKPSFKSAVSTAATNFYIQPSQTTHDELVQNMQEGLIITELQGLHAGTNTTSGDFSLSADGYFVQGGKIVRPIEQITIAGNFFELLKNVTAIADNLKFQMPSGSGNIGAPSILIKELNVTGL